MSNALLTAVIIFGLSLGSIQIVAAVYVWVKQEKFGFGGAVLTIFGTVLIGLSIWNHIEIEISQKVTKVKLGGNANIFEVHSEYPDPVQQINSALGKQKLKGSQ